MNIRKGPLAQAIFLLIFAGGFFVMRAFVFREKHLEAVFGLSAGTVEIFFARIRKTRVETIRLEDLETVVIEAEKSCVANPDGAEFVSKISAQHGMAMPGFNEEKNFYALKLKLVDGRERILYADEEMQAVMEAYGEIVQFLGRNAEPATEKSAPE